ncbi:ATP-binding protein (plasmid) [Mesorhizobium onobrychidis]|uniref:ATP-binding protein n=1 Tax=Mesorhizobium onobrychidis TaxID=2775404 RepID=A0ABY5R7V0_9HYPH|nr:ATP-binding protein [Mesorhizobium onobrychidis]
MKVLETLTTRGQRMLLLIDEMGKLLEHAANGDGDAHFFQDLAELASRSNGRLVVIGVLHQAFDDYAYRLARETRDDWLKIQGRFVDIPLNPTGEEQVELLSRAIESSQTPTDTTFADRVAREIHGDRPGAEQFAKRLAACWPLNPVVACLLGPLSRRRFGQNQRSLFGFLGSAEPFGFQEYLDSTQADSRRDYDVTWLWSYLRINLEPSILASPDGHRWAVAVDAIERCESHGGTDLELGVLKAVALIDLFRERSGLVASRSIIETAVHLSETDAKCTLDRLRDWSLVVYRRHLGGFSLYAGSDFDVDAAVEEARAQQSSCDYGRLRQTGVLAPILAKRHYHDTGAMRWFDVDLAPLENASARLSSMDTGTGAAGLFLLIVNDQGASSAKIRRQIEKLTAQVGDEPVAFAVSADSFMLRELTLELLALERIQVGRPELKGDAVARREVSGRIARLAGELEARLRQALVGACWTAPAINLDMGSSRLLGAAGLSIMASRMAKELYPDAPLIRNELVNRSKPSSNAMGAIRALMIAMVTSADRERLDIVGYPPEAGLYVSLLERTGLHRRGEDGAFVFQGPPEHADKARLAKLWTVGDMLLAERPSVTMADLHDCWRDRPVGAKEGLLPIFGLAFLLSRRADLAIYLDGRFCPSIGDLLVDRMLQDPGSVQMRWSNVSERDASILRGLANAMAELGEDLSALEPLAIGRQLVAVVLATPTWTRRTSRIGLAATKVRDLALAAHDPNKLLLEDLPAIAGADATVPKIVALLQEGMRELQTAYGTMLGEINTLLMAELKASDAGFAVLRERARRIIGLTGNYRLDAFATRLSTYNGELDALEGLASLAANKPPRDWVDRDVDAARVEIAALAQQFLRGEAFAHVGGRRLERFAIAVYMSDPSRAALVAPEINLDGAALRRARSLAMTLHSTLGDDVPRDVAIAAAAELMAVLAENRDEADPAERLGRRGAVA